MHRISVIRAQHGCTGVSRLPHHHGIAAGFAVVFGLLAFIVLCASRANAAVDGRTPSRPAAGTITVTNTNDSGVGSLYQAIINAASGDTITFDVSVSGVISLSRQLLINKNLTIVGPGADKLAISGNGVYRIFYIYPGNVTLSDLTLRDGYGGGRGGAIMSTQAVTLNHVNVLSNTSGGEAGGVYATGALVLNGGVFRNNTGQLGGGVYVYGTLTMSGTQFISNTANIASGMGGGAYVSCGGGGDTFPCSATLTGGEFRANQSTYDGGALVVAGGTSITGTLFISNTATRYGGAVYHSGNALVSVSGGIFQNNATAQDGGAVYSWSSYTLSGTQFISNTAGGAGGGIYGNWYATIIGGRFERNRSITKEGGGIKTFHTLTLTGTQLISNVAGTSGGAIYANSDMTITQAVLNSNKASDTGGALWSGQGVRVIQSELLSNTAGNTGGALFSYGPVNLIANTLAWNQASMGGAIGHLGTRMVISNSTLSSNHAITGAALYQELFSLALQTLIVNSTLVSNSADVPANSAIWVQSGILSVTNTILANPGGNNLKLGVGAIFVSAGHNLVNGTITHAVSSDLLYADPLIGPLQAAPGNGRAPLMHALLPGSPAIDAGDGSACPPADQRGIDRPLIDGCDIGAYESRGFLVNAQGELKQATPINAPFTAPLSASVSSPYAEPVDGGRLVFTPHPSTHGASTASPVYTATILSGGAAQSVNANGIGGTYTVTAMARGVYTPATYTLTNIIARLDMSATPDLLLANGVSTSLVTVVAWDQDQALAGYAIILTATKGHFTSDIGTQSIMITTDVAGVATAAFTAYSTPGVGIVKAVLAVTPAISRSVAITLVTPTTGLAGQLRKQFGGVITYTWVVTNLGPAPALYVVITGVVPANTRVLTDRVSGGAWDGANGIVTSTASLAVNETLAVTYAVEPINRTGNILAYAEAVSANSAYVGTNTDILTRSFLMKVMRE